MSAGPEGKPPSYFAGISAINPWSKPATPIEGAGEKDEVKDDKDAASTPTKHAQRGGDHSTGSGHRLRIKVYPRDCPPLKVQWFHATNSPLRRPNYGAAVPKIEKAPPPPKRWLAFSKGDSKTLEEAFHTLADEQEQLEREGHLEPEAEDVNAKGHRPTRSKSLIESERHRVAVNEDYLFDVNIQQRELAPAYWLGPVYSVRRGTWFYVEGSGLKPCDEKLAYQLEEGYTKLKPWRKAKRSSSQAPLNKDDAKKIKAAMDRPRAASDVTGAEDAFSESASDPATSSYRLFGTYMNSVVTYEDEVTAWLLSDDFLSRMSSTVYERFAGGAHRSGTKVVRGYTDIKKDAKKKKEDKQASTPTKSAETTSPVVVQENTPEIPRTASPVDQGTEAKEPEPEPETHVRFLERQMSNLVSSAFQDDPKRQDEEARKRAEDEIREDYRETEGEAQDREIDHLVLVTHGIGQRLGARFETFNFIHDVNAFRKTLKAVYLDSEDLQALNAETSKMPKNCRVQVLPICWRHMLDFPRQSFKSNRDEHDLADAASEDDSTYPTLDDITIDGVPALRNIISDLALDVLLYQTPAYKSHISLIVAKECNRIIKLFKQRNPTFRGKISLVGHSLGSAVFFDLLSDQVIDQPTLGRASYAKPTPRHGLKLDFDVENLLCVGSPIGLFQMLNGKTIAGRPNPNQVTLDGSEEGVEDPFDAYSKLPRRQIETHNDTVVSSPKCRQLFNIFHPSDPISYRMEPLISTSMSTLKPQPLPYTKKSFLGAPMGHGLTGIPARVGQTFSGFWTNFSSGITNNFINRSLGITAEDAARLSEPAPVPHNRLTELSAGAGTNISAGGVLSADYLPAVVTNENDRKRQVARDTADAEQGQKPPTLIDGEIETLYSGFAKRRKFSKDQDGKEGAAGDSDSESEGTWDDAGERGRRLRREEAKVRALNSNGRVDYSIQEGAFDISFLTAIANHLAYWTDEDVCHFVLSQLLAGSGPLGAGAAGTSSPLSRSASAKDLGLGLRIER